MTHSPTRRGRTDVRLLYLRQGNVLTTARMMKNLLPKKAKLDVSNLYSAAHSTLSKGDGDAGKGDGGDGVSGEPKSKAHKHKKVKKDKKK